MRRMDQKTCCHSSTSCIRSRGCGVSCGDDDIRSTLGIGLRSGLVRSQPLARSLGSGRILGPRHQQARLGLLRASFSMKVFGLGPSLISPVIWIRNVSVIE